MKKILKYSTLLFASALIANASSQLAKADSVDQEGVTSEFVADQAKTPENVPVVSATCDDFSQGQLSYTEQDQANIAANNATDSGYSYSGSRTVNTYTGGYTITYPGDGSQPSIEYRKPQVNSWTWTYGNDDQKQPATETPAETPTEGTQEPAKTTDSQDNKGQTGGTTSNWINPKPTLEYKPRPNSRFWDYEPTPNTKPAQDPKPAEETKPTPKPTVNPKPSEQPKPTTGNKNDPWSTPKPTVDPKPAEQPKPQPNPYTEEPINPRELGATTGASWDKPSANIYLDPNLNDKFRTAYLDAISQWNNTGAFTFNIVNNINDANIIGTQEYNRNTNAAGVTESRYNPYAGRMNSATIKLNGYYLLNPQFGYNQERITNTAAHELGHAIGLDHNNGDSLMQPAGSYKGIRPVDINTVRNIYKKNNQAKPSWT